MSAPLGEIKILGRETAIYGLSTVLARLLNFLLLPFYTHYLKASEYGVVAAVFAYIAFLNILYQYGMDQAYMRHASEEGTRRESLFSTCLWSLLATSLLLSVGLYLGAVQVSAIIGLGPNWADLIRTSAWILSLDALAILPFAELRLQHQPWAFVGIKSVHILVNVLMNIALVAVVPMGVHGVFLASLTASVASLIMLAPVLAMRLRLVFERSLLPSILSFGLPFVPAGLGAMMVQVIDRPMLLWMTDLTKVGLYQANYRLGIFMLLFVNMFDQAWRPFVLERAKRQDSGMLGRVLTYFMLAGILLVLALSFFIGEIVRIPILGQPLIHPDYWPGLGIVPIILVSYLFHGAYINFMASVLLAKRTEVLAGITFLGAGINILTNLVTIPYWGILGAAWATLAAYAAMALSLYWIGRGIYPIAYEYDRLAHLGCAVATVLAAAYAAHAWLAGTPEIYWFVARLGILALLPALLGWTGFFNEEEIQGLRKLLRLRKKTIS